MNPAVFASLPASACTLGTAGSFGSDRIAKSVYDAAGQVMQQQVAIGTADAATEASFTYTDNGKLQTLKDAANNLTTYIYDDHDRLSETRYPTKTPKGAGTSDANDNEVLTYDANGNVVGRQLRDNRIIGFTYDNLNRPTLKNLPGTEPDVAYAYDKLGRLTSVSQTGNSLSFSYDALSRNLTQVGPQGTATSEWDVAGRRTRLTYPGGGLYVTYDYLVTGEMTRIRENGATSGVGVLAIFAYDDLGRRTSTSFGNGVVQAYGYDSVSRLASLTNNLSGTANDLSATFAYNPASQIVSTVRTGDAYAYTDHFDMNVTGTANGLNQLTQVGSKSLTHDANGNVTMFGTRSFTYSSENLLLTGPNSTTLSYDPALRLYQTVAGTATVRMAYDGLDRIAEYDGSNALQRRYVHGPGMDQPLVWYEGSGTTDRRFLSSDERGSIISVTDSSGALLRINRYDEYGNPQSTNLGLWGYTGQAWLPGMGGWYYKARVYDQELGRFLQTDPIDVAGGINLYAYVGNDPVNWIDPLGLDGQEVTVTGYRLLPAMLGGFGGSVFAGIGSGYDPTARLDQAIRQLEHDVCAADPQCATVTGRRDELFKEAKVDKSLVDFYLWTHPQQKRNLYNNLRRLLGQKFSDKQIRRILNEVLNLPETTRADLEALASIRPDARGHIELTKRQKAIIDRFAKGISSTTLNKDAIQYYTQGLQTGRIMVR